MCPNYMHIWQYILLNTAHAAYIYIQHEILNNHAQATDTAGSSSKHRITIQ